MGARFSIIAGAFEPFLPLKQPVFSQVHGGHVVAPGFFFGKNTLDARQIIIG
jgi:hypothetical protein